MATTTNTNRAELSHAAHCLALYLNNTAEIYSRFTIPAIDRATMLIAESIGTPGALERVTELTRTSSTYAVKEAARLVRKYDELNPTQADKEAVTAQYVAYIMDCALYDYKNK